MPCSSDHLAPRAREIDEVQTSSKALKAAVDELTHYCDGIRDILEAHFVDNTQPLLTEVMHGHHLVDVIEAKIVEVNNEYGFRASSGHTHQEAASMLIVADIVTAQFERINDAVVRQQHGRYATKKQIAQLRLDQIQHRMGDMMRVYKHFATKATVSEKQIATLSNIDLTKPLTPQLGFDPDTV